MENINKDFLDSLDLLDKEMEKHIPYVLQDLWELGSIPEYIYQLINDNVDSKRIGKIVDLGCGKGAVLIYLAKRLEFQGLGIDIVSDFIEAAKRHSIENSVNNRLDFVASDFLDYIDQNKKYEIVIYGYDSGILGDVLETITRLQNCISDSGYLILEIAFTPDNKEKIEGLPTERELLEHLDKSDLKIIDKILWHIDTISAINNENNSYINKRIEELKKAYPEKTQIFEQYMSNQIDECKMIENEMICSTWILSK
ncbi:MAG: class I SAM-dependent methyltransferase [Bacteroidetes bacterium]|nr:class I SAM-dependent methyltransferase [Bacteroidota bacterium]